MSCGRPPEITLDYAHWDGNFNPRTPEHQPKSQIWFSVPDGVCITYVDRHAVQPELIVGDNSVHNSAVERGTWTG